MKHIVIVGAGGFAQEVCGAAKVTYESVVVCVYNPGLYATEICGCSVLGTPEQADIIIRQRGTGEVSYICAIGNNAIREQEVCHVDGLGWKPVAVVHPKAIVESTAVIGAGSYVAAGAVVSAGARVGKHAIVNYCASVAHDTILGDFSQVCPGARVNGWCEIGRSAFVGSNAVLAPKTRIGEGASLGACAFARHSVPAGEVWAGVPARIIKTH